MARDPSDLAIAEQFREQFAAHLPRYGYENAADLADEDFHTIANEVLRQNLAALYGAATRADGLTVDVSAAPQWAARLAATGATHRDVAEFAEGVYPHLRPEEARAKFARDLSRASGSTVAEPREPRFDRPF